MWSGLLKIQEMPQNQAPEEELASSLVELGFKDFRDVESHSGSSQYIISFSTTEIVLSFTLPATTD